MNYKKIENILFNSKKENTFYIIYPQESTLKYRKKLVYGTPEIGKR